MGDLSNWKDNCYTVRELIAELVKYPGETIIILASDGEGNNHSPLSSVDIGHYEPLSTWSGEVKDSQEQFNEDTSNDADYTYQDYIRNAYPVVVLGPVN